MCSTEDRKYPAILLPEPSPDSTPEPELIVPSESSQQSMPDPIPTRDKGKKRAVDPASDDQTASVSKKTKSTTAESDKASKSSGSSRAKSEQSRVGGRQLGSSNYSEADMRQLLKIVRRLLPSGPYAWTHVMEEFNAWARKKGRPTRNEKSIRGKFDGFIREGSKKPTGEAEVPWYIEEAMEIQFCIDGKVGVQELDDSQMR
ncbi:hypothetical protein BV20DRAFT_1058620 [Pilatotrama ljubarskyi]|nr:hypothetical protein BV20DRAFT_1058620 [Pilatotrama ljubarskyi]